MTIVIALILAVIAGVMNGSFALPTKHVEAWRFENIWLNYGLWTFLIIPWVVAIILCPQIITIYQHVDTNLIWIMIIGGFCFGVGQVCFALALNMIGLGLGFVLNIGLGTGLGFFLPLVVMHPDQLSTPFGMMTLLGTVIIIIGLLISYKAGKLRDGSDTTSNASHYQLGVLLAVIAGLFSAGQNFTFALTTPMHDVAVLHHATPLAASIIMWPGFLLASLVPYVSYMLYLHKKNDSFANYKKPGFINYMGLALIMGVLWYGSLVLYSKISQMIGAVGPVVGWPLFMVLIILTSSFWGWRHGEWNMCTGKIKSKALTGIAFLVAAVVVLAYSVSLA